MVAISDLAYGCFVSPFFVENYVRFSWAGSLDYCRFYTFYFTFHDLFAALCLISLSCYISLKFTGKKTQLSPPPSPSPTILCNYRSDGWEIKKVSVMERDGVKRRRTKTEGDRGEEVKNPVIRSIINEQMSRNIRISFSLDLRDIAPSPAFSRSVPS